MVSVLDTIIDPHPGPVYYLLLNYNNNFTSFDEFIHMILDMKYLPMHRSMASSPASTSVRSSHQQHSGRFCMILSKKYQAFLPSKSVKFYWIPSKNVQKLIVISYFGLYIILWNIGAIHSSFTYSKWNLNMKLLLRTWFLLPV